MIREATFVDYKDVPEPAFTALAHLEEFISDLDGKAIATPIDDSITFIDEGTVDADDAVRAFNLIVVALALRSREGQVEGCSEDAAADMLAALRLIDQMARDDEHRGDDLLWTTQWQRAVDDARAAIAKATSAPPSPPTDLVEVKRALEPFDKLIARLDEDEYMPSLRGRLKLVDGNEAHRILPEIWPSIQSILALSDYAKARKAMASPASHKTDPAQALETMKQALAFYADNYVDGGSKARMALEAVANEAVTTGERGKS